MSEIAGRRRKPSHHEIAVSAYRIWERERANLDYTDALGAERAVPNWLRAERELVMNDPLSWACGACAAQPGEPCVWEEAGDGELYHAERIEVAATRSAFGSESEGEDGWV